MIRFFTGHPTAANLLMSLFMIAGLLSWPRMIRETMPEYAPREVEIRIPYPGATAEDVEDTVSRRVEDALEDIEYLQELRSDSREGLSITLAEMSEGGNFQTFFNDIERSIQRVDDFPEDAEFPVIQELGRTNLVLSLLVSGPLSPGDLKIYAEDLKDRMREAGLPLVDIEGFSQRHLRVTLSESALRQKGLTVPMVTEAILAQSQNKPLGMLETPNQDILMRFDDQGRSPQELEDLVIWGDVGGGILRLGDVATLENLFELEEEKILLEGERCARLNIRKTKGEDTLEVAQRAKAFLALEKQRHPQMNFTVSRDESLALGDRLNLLLRNGVQGLVLVFLAMWLFFHIRISFWVTMGLPVSFLGAFLVAPYLGMTINMFTLVGLLLALGLLMDDAIVIAENIAAHRERGEDPFTAAVEGTRDVAAGVISSFITTLCVLGPLGFISGQIGRVLRVVPIILLLVLAISLIEAFAILPAHLYHAMQQVSSSKKDNPLRRTLEVFLENFREKVVGKTVDFLLPRRYFVLGTIMGLFILSLGMVLSGKVKIQGFPELEGQVVLARLLFPGGTPLARTEERVDQILEALKRTNQAFSADQPPGRDLVQNAYVQFNQNTEAFEKGPHVATITVDLLPPEERGGTIEAYLAEWRRQIGPLPDVLGLTLGEPGFGPGGRPIEIRLRGESLQELKEAALDLHTWFNQYKGVTNLMDDLRQGKPELRLRMRPSAYGMGVTGAEVANQLRGAFQGVTAYTFRRGGEDYELQVQLDPEKGQNLQNFENFTTLLKDGAEVPLRSVASWEEVRGWSRIGRYNHIRTVTLFGDVDSRFLSTLELMKTFRSSYLPQFSKKYPAVKVSIAGELAETGHVRNSIFFALGIGLLGIFFLLSLQFRSYTEPLIVMVAIPFALIGVVWGHLFMGVPISMPSFLGFAALAGVVVNDSILLVLFLKNARTKHPSLLHAAAAASRERFRAVMLTSSTTVAGLIPLLSEPSLQAQVLKPLVISTAFGLMASTLLVLLALPCMYMILGDFGWIERLEPSAIIPEKE